MWLAWRRKGVIASDPLRQPERMSNIASQLLENLNEFAGFAPCNTSTLRLNTMITTITDEGLDLLFRQARTHAAWIDKPVTDEAIRRVYDLMKWGPTSANSCPARFFFLRSPEAKQRLKPLLSPGNVDKTMAAPVTVIVAYDLALPPREHYD